MYWQLKKEEKKKNSRRGTRYFLDAQIRRSKSQSRKDVPLLVQNITGRSCLRIFASCCELKDDSITVLETSHY